MAGKAPTRLPESHANRGLLLEDLLIMSCEYYRTHGKAVIRKVPTAWTPIRDRRGRIVSAKVEDKTTVDFIGNYRGQPIAFEAKQTNDKRIRWDRVAPHQADFLTDWHTQGGITFVVVGFMSHDRFSLVPWPTWRALASRATSASVSIDNMVKDSEIPFSGTPVLDFLPVIDRLWGGL